MQGGKIGREWGEGGEQGVAMEVAMGHTCREFSITGSPA
jgi:hypothetical protein